MGLFGKTKQAPPKEQVREWTSKIRKEGYQLDRQIHRIKAEEEKVKRSLKESAKKGDKDVCLILAKEIVHSRKAVGRLHTAKAQLNSVQMQMQEQLSTLRIAGALKASTDVMRAMQSLVKVPEVARTMQELSKEMMRAGIIEEMMDDAMESAIGDDEETETEAQEEVDKVLWELTAGQLGAAPSAVTDTLPAEKEPAAAAAAARVPVAAGGGEDDDDDEEDLSEMRHRLEALRST